MRRHELIIGKLLLSLTLGMMGCQPAAPRRGYSYNQVSAYGQNSNNSNNAPVDYSQFANNNSGNQTTPSNPGTQPPAASAACQSNSRRVQALIDRCKAEIDENYNEIRQASPSCLTAFYNLAPSNCNSLSTQISNLRNNCGNLLTQNSSYFPNCYSAYINF